MDKPDRYRNAAMSQLLAWARAYVDNETVIPECPDATLTDTEKLALCLMRQLEIDYGQT